MQFRAGMGCKFRDMRLGGALMLRRQRRDAPCQQRGILFQLAQQTLGTVDLDIQRKQEELTRL